MKTMNRYLRKYRKLGKPESWIKGWKRAWYEAGRRFKKGIT